MRDVRKMAEIWPIAEAALRAGGCFRLWPSGRSMLPLLREGRDSVLLLPPTDLQRFDILLVRTPDGQFYLHRAVTLTEAEVDRYSSHSLRATFITLSFSAGVPERDIAAVSSHKSAAIREYDRRSAEAHAQIHYLAGTSTSPTNDA